MKMKVLILLSVIFITTAVNAQADKPEEAVLAEKQNAFKGLFYKVWSKFKSLSPKKENGVRKVAVTMGVRGAETTSSILEPYWKDDKTSDKQFMQQLEDFAQAQTLADRGDLASSNKAFTGFIDKYPKSDLKPNAQFAEALTMGAMGKSLESKQSFKVFIDENPGHPLVGDAKQVMQELAPL